ncbi:MAG: dihydroorotate dehydrogenase electron transfer subunit [Roseburia sp.]|nr:dihydroorotate dehydrogenase electron transfer subunit [Roseburia sp.]
MKAVKTDLTVQSVERYGRNVYRVECASETRLPKISAGQFAHLQVPGKQLRRPICVYKNTENTITFIIASVGDGTAAFLSQKKGDRFDAILPLGNGFPVLPDKTNIALLGGGTGCAPLYKIAADNPSLNCTALLGFPNAATRDAYGDDFDKVCRKVCYCTDDGSVGYHGFPTELLTEIAPEVLYVCGAAGMVKTAQKYCETLGITGFVSVEQRMGCGVGACLVCAVKVKREGEERLLRACADGPVFDIREIAL